MASALQWHSEFAAEEAAERRSRPRSLSVGDAPFEALPELCDEVVVVVNGTFYELQRAASALAVEDHASDIVLLSDCEECKSSSSTAECKSMRWSEEGTTAGSGHDTESVVDLASEGGSEGDDAWCWAWTPTNAELSELSYVQCWPGQKPQQKRRVRRRGVRPQLPSSCAGTEPTTLLLKGLGTETSSSKLVEFLEEQGLGGDFDFVYAPASFKNWEAVGYAIVNMVDHAAALKALDMLEGLGDVTVGWNDPCQGLEVQIGRYRNSPVMHASVPDECRPRFFSQGMRKAFPQPTRAIKPPR